MDKNWSYINTLLGFAIYYLLFSVLDILGTIINLNSFYNFFLTTIISGLFLLFILFLFVFRNNGLNDKIDFYGTNSNSQDIKLGVVTGLIIGGLGLVSILMKGNGIFSFFSIEYLKDNIFPEGLLGKILFVLIFVFFIPVLEEYYYRGFMYVAFNKAFGFIIAGIITALCSSIFLSGSISFIYLFISGFVYCVLAEKTKGIGSSTIAHILGNLIITFTMIIKGGS